ncbi:OB-fold protein [Clostridium beijerinckii]|uniref:OB-fold protein n=1 Tax=Clostridium beijerinckii TaxID=1520 RepID=UPI00080A1A73|nr:hypothetical protein [Clostridium beijerinckii]OCB00382.1 hypothetical protein BGS1_15690 [Clostridium beijerinckii]
MSEMVKCKACGKEIAKGVKKCVHCGKDQRNFFMKHKILTAIVVIVILGGIAAAGGKKDSTDTAANKTETNQDSTNTAATKTEKKQEVKEEVVKVSAVDLAKAYEDNEVSADKSYKDKTAEINGKVSDIGVVGGQTYIVLSSEKDMSVTDVQCFFDEQSEIDKVSNLKKGDTVTVQGKIDGKSMNVGVNNCKIK